MILRFSPSHKLKFDVELEGRLQICTNKGYPHPLCPRVCGETRNPRQKQSGNAPPLNPINAFQPVTEKLIYGKSLGSSFLTIPSYASPKLHFSGTVRIDITVENPTAKHIPSTLPKHKNRQKSRGLHTFCLSFQPVSS